MAYRAVIVASLLGATVRFVTVIVTGFQAIAPRPVARLSVFYVCANPILCPQPIDQPHQVHIVGEVLREGLP